MNADWNDAPSRIQRKAGNAIVWCVSLVFGLGITGGGLYLASGHMKPNPRAEAQLARLNADAIRKHNEELRTRQLANQQRYQAPPMEEKNWIRSTEAQQTVQANRELKEWSRQRAQETHERQTVFNDNNYAPKQPVNTYKAAPAPVVQQIASAPRQQQRTVQREHTSKWIKSWNGGTNYLAEWISVNNYIDGTTVCANHKRGSIDYRECRKAAKQHYHEECRTWRARYDNDRKDNSDRMRDRYCVAASSFNPMG